MRQPITGLESRSGSSSVTMNVQRMYKIRYDTGHVTGLSGDKILCDGFCYGVLLCKHSGIRTFVAEQSRRVTRTTLLLDF